MIRYRSFKDGKLGSFDKTTVPASPSAVESAEESKELRWVVEVNRKHFRLAFADCWSVSNGHIVFIIDNPIVKICIEDYKKMHQTLDGVYAHNSYLAFFSRYGFLLFMFILYSKVVIHILELSFLLRLGKKIDNNT